MLTVTLLLGGCSGDGEMTATDADGTLSDLGEADVEVEVAPPPCPIRDGQAREPDFVIEGCHLVSTGIETFETDADLQELQGTRLRDCLDSRGHEFDLDSIDFTTSRLMILTSSVGSTCRLELERALVYESSQEIGLELWTWDHSRDCEVVCAQLGSALIGVVVPRETDAVSCLQERGGCSQR